MLAISHIEREHRHTQTDTHWATHMYMYVINIIILLDNMIQERDTPVLMMVLVVMSSLIFTIPAAPHPLTVTHNASVWILTVYALNN